MWNGLFFQRTSLKELGLRVQLGHPPGQFCHTRDKGRDDFTVVHTNGIHLVQVDWCRCEGVEHHTQLLRIGWWPATPLQPQSCATLEVLRQFHVLNLQGKLTGFSFYRSLEFLTDNTGLRKLPVSLAFNSIASSSNHSLLGSTACVDDYGARVSLLANGQACRLRLRSGRCCSNKTRCTRHTVPCVPPAEHQSATGLAAYTARESVSDFACEYQRT